MQSPSSVVYNTSVEQKRHAQEVAKRQRLGAPKLRELLREKCRIRIINARKDNVDGNRKMQLVKHTTYTVSRSLFRQCLAKILKCYKV
ncbi:GH22474 [Drosophila grimshawi]|uniref:GH22474 n=1 Tax=Drosophila grimshawi TaxID=7222 RepID=B4K3E8_DROGR|nr:GH22474 [Drosophila grimshawi]